MPLKRSNKAVTECSACLHVPGTCFFLLLSHYDNRMFSKLYSVDFSHLATVPAESGVLASGAPPLKAGKLPLVEVD